MSEAAGIGQLAAMIADLTAKSSAAPPSWPPLGVAAEEKASSEIAELEARNQRLDDLAGELRRLVEVRPSQLWEAYKDIVR